MYTVWNLITCQGKSSSGNCGRAPNAQAGQSFTSRMFVCKHDLRLAETNPNTCEVLVPDCRAEMKARAWRQSSRRQKRNDKDHFKRPPTTPVPVSIKAATQELCFWVTQEPVDTEALNIPSRDKDAFNSSRKLLYNYAIRSLPQLQTDKNTRVVMM